MNVELMNQPSSTVAKISLKQGQTCVAEGGAMLAMLGSMKIETTTRQRGQKGGIFSGLKRLFTGESFFLNHFTATKDDDEIWMSHSLPGDMKVIDISLDHQVIVAGGSFVACQDTVTMDSSWQGMKSLFSGEGLFWLRAQGQGPLVVSSYGTIYSVQVSDGYIVDSSHIVAFEDTLNFEITKIGKSWLTSFLGGEGFVCRFKGRGRIWCQSHNAQAFGKALGPQLRPRKQQ